MNVEKLKRLQAQVRIGGKGTPRRKKKVTHQTAATDDKKLQSSLKKLSVSTIPGIEEVNIIKDDLTVINFNNPKAQASLSANTFAVIGHGETKKVVEMLPEILPQLGQETVVQLRKFANLTSKLVHNRNQKPQNSAQDDADDVSLLVDDFDEIAKQEASLEFSSTSNARSNKKNKKANHIKTEDKINVEKQSKPDEEFEAHEEEKYPKIAENKTSIEAEKPIGNKELLLEGVQKLQVSVTMKNSIQNKNAQKDIKSVEDNRREEQKAQIKTDIELKVVQEGDVKQFSNQADKKKQQDKLKKTSQSPSIKGTQQPKTRPIILGKTVVETGSTNNANEKKEINTIQNKEENDEKMSKAPQTDMNISSQILQKETKESMTSPEIKENIVDLVKSEDKQFIQQHQSSENIISNAERVVSETNNDDIALPIEAILAPQQREHNITQPVAAPKLDAISKEFINKPDSGTSKPLKKFNEVSVTAENNTIGPQECVLQTKPTISTPKVKEEDLKNVSNNAKNVTNLHGRSQKKPTAPQQKTQSAVGSQLNQKPNANKQATAKNQGTQENKLDLKKATSKIEIKKDCEIRKAVSGEMTKQFISNSNVGKNPPTQQCQAEITSVISDEKTKQPSSNIRIGKNQPTPQRQAEISSVGVETPKKLNEKQAISSNTTRSAKPAVSAIKKHSVVSNTSNTGTNSNKKVSPSPSKPKSPNPQAFGKLGKTDVILNSTSSTQSSKNSENQDILSKPDTKSAPSQSKTNAQQ